MMSMYDGCTDIDNIASPSAYYGTDMTGESLSTPASFSPWRRAGNFNGSRNWSRYQYHHGRHLCCAVSSVGLGAATEAKEVGPRETVSGNPQNTE